jgi:hypothetical protein
MRSGRDDPLRARRTDEPEQRPATAEPEPLPHAARLLALQRSAGNQAVSALLARAPETAAPTDDKGAKTSGPRATGGGSATESWTLSFSSIEHSFEGAPDESGGGDRNRGWGDDPGRG